MIDEKNKPTERKYHPMIVEDLLSRLHRFDFKVMLIYFFIKFRVFIKTREFLFYLRGK